MYSLLREHILSSCSKYLAGAITAQQSNMDIGSPCIVDFGRIRTSDKETTDKLRDAVKDIFTNGKNIPIALNKLLYDIDDRSDIHIPVIHLFPSRTDVNMSYVENRYSSEIHCVRTIALLSDDYKSERLDSLRQLKVDNAKLFFENIGKDLDKYRYVNYIVDGICASKVSAIYSDISMVTNSLSYTYPRNTCTYIRGGGSSTLLDTLSISFYKLSDVIPIFDKKCSDGIAIEILLTNALLTAEDIISNSNNYILVRFLFSKYNDNLFTIDGEKIKRPFQCTINESIEINIDGALTKYTPDDRALNKLKSNNGGE